MIRETISTEATQKSIRQPKHKRPQPRTDRQSIRTSPIVKTEHDSLRTSVIRKPDVLNKQLIDLLKPKQIARLREHMASLNQAIVLDGQGSTSLTQRSRQKF